MAESHHRPRMSHHTHSSPCKANNRFPRDLLRNFPCGHYLLLCAEGDWRTGVYLHSCVLKYILYADPYSNTNIICISIHTYTYTRTQQRNCILICNRQQTSRGKSRQNKQWYTYARTQARKERCKDPRSQSLECTRDIQHVQTPVQQQRAAT